MKTVKDSPAIGRTPSDIDHDMLVRLRAAAAMPDTDINLGDPDAPLVTDWSGAERGRFLDKAASANTCVGTPTKLPLKTKAWGLFDAAIRCD